VRRADSTEGDIDTLSARIAEIRTWTYVSHRPGWLADPTHWQEKTRDIEDRLSDALHERLTKRFVDRRTSVLMRRLRENEMLEAEIGPSGEVLVEGHHVGELQGFRFTADQTAEGEDAKAVRAAAQKALAAEFENRAQRFLACRQWRSGIGIRRPRALAGHAGCRADLQRGSAAAARRDLLADEHLTGPARDKVAARLERFVGFQIETALKPLNDLKAAEQLSGIARGVAFRLVENFGILNRRDVAEDIRALDQDARGALRRLGVRFGAFHIFVPALIKPAPAGLLSLALGTAERRQGQARLRRRGRCAGRRPHLDRRRRELREGLLPPGRLPHRRRRAVRVDILERLADLIRPALAWKPGQGPAPDGAYDGNAFVVTPAMMSILGATPQDMEEILKALGYRGQECQAAEVEAKLDGLDAAAAAEAKAASSAPLEAPAARQPGDRADDAGDGDRPTPEKEAAASEPEARRRAAASEAPPAEADAVAEPAADESQPASPEAQAELRSPLLAGPKAGFQQRGAPNQSPRSGRGTGDPTPAAEVFRRKKVPKTVIRCGVPAASMAGAGARGSGRSTNRQGKPGEKRARGRAMPTQGRAAIARAASRASRTGVRSGAAATRARASPSAVEARPAREPAGPRSIPIRPSPSSPPSRTS
jgi:ATP-dependent RNA helicase SUPV3L1/SUV3